MKNVLFCTGNARKIHEANQTLADYDITVEPIKLEFDEIQHSDPTEVAKSKAVSAYELCQQPVVVSDTSWSIPALGGFPGAYMKDIEAWFDVQDWLALISRHDDKTIYCHEHVAYYDGDQLQHFMHTYQGSFVDQPRGKTNDDESFEQVVTLYGGETMAEQLERGEVASAGSELKHWQQFGQWFSA